MQELDPTSLHDILKYHSEGDFRRKKKSPSMFLLHIWALWGHEKFVQLVIKAYWLCKINNSYDLIPCQMNVFIISFCIPFLFLLSVPSLVHVLFSFCVTIQEFAAIFKLWVFNAQKGFIFQNIIPLQVDVIIQSVNHGIVA